MVDLDECQSPDACRASHVCNNTVGSYRCECLTGFATDPDAKDPLDPVCIGKICFCCYGYGYDVDDDTISITTTSITTTIITWYSAWKAYLFVTIEALILSYTSIFL